MPHGQRSITDIQRHKKELAEAKGKPAYLPSDFTQDINPQHAWFLKYGISLEVAKSYGFGYSEFFHRIVMPIYMGDKLKAVHLRAINPDDKPKYLNLGTPEPHTLFYSSGPVRESGLVIVEDVLSAIKVNLAGYQTVALNGSSITDVQALRISGNGLTARFYVWLDNDPAGHKGAKDVVKQLKMHGQTNINRVQSERDPKTYTKDDIRKLIKEAYLC